VNAIRRASEELQQAASQLASSGPVGQGESPNPEDSGQTPHGNPDVVEGEFHEA